MPKFKVFMQEIHIQEVIVEAENRDEARKKASEADGDYGDCTYERIMNETDSEWVVEEA